MHFQRLAYRPVVLALSAAGIGIGLYGFVVAAQNFSMLPQDGGTMTPAEVAKWNTRQSVQQPQLDHELVLLLVGGAGTVLLPFAFRPKVRGICRAG